METMLETLKQLNNKGFTDNLIVKEGNLMTSSRELLPAEKLELVDTYRIEGDSDPMHQSILYAIKCENPSIKGVLVSSYGPYSDAETNKFVEKHLE